MSDEQAKNVVAIVPGKSDAEVALDIKVRVAAAMAPVLELFDEAARSGFMIRWDAVAPEPPYFRHGIIGLRLEKRY